MGNWQTDKIAPKAEIAPVLVVPILATFAPTEQMNALPLSLSHPQSL